MLTKFTPKAIVLGIISGLILIFGAMGVEITRAQLFDIRNSIAKLQEAAALMLTAKANQTSADAEMADTVNKLTGVLETAAATKEVGRLQAAAMIQMANATSEAAKTAAKGLVEATKINMHPENEMYDSVTGPLFGEPSKRMAEINAELISLGWSVDKGIDPTTGRTLGVEERLNAWGKQQRLQRELEIVEATGKKNWQDVTRMGFEALTGSFGAIGGLYPSGNEPVPVRRIIQEP